MRAPRLAQPSSAGGGADPAATAAPAIVDVLGRTLGVSRRAARLLVQDGRLTLADGGAVVDPRRAVPGGVLDVRLDDRPLRLRHDVTLLQNKPAGCVTALRDGRHDTAYGLLRTAPLFPLLRPVGRLDLDTTGLLLWTTDGQLVHRLTHPRHAVPRTYQAALAGSFRAPPRHFALDDGHRPLIDDLAEILRSAAHPALAAPAETTVFATVTLVGGAYHEVRRIFAALGSHVLALCRVRFGTAALPVDLAPGSYREIAPAEVTGHESAT